MIDDLDKLDRKILDLLGNNGRIPNVILSKQLGIPNTTVHKRIKQLTDKDFIKFSCEIEANKLPDIFFFIVCINMNESREKDLYKTLEELKSLPNMIFSSMATGRYDFIAMFAVRTRKEVTDMIIKNINNIQGVMQCESFLILDSRGLSLKSNLLSNLLKQ